MNQKDPTEDLRRILIKNINENPCTREDLEKRYGQVWDTQELQNDFEVTGFMAPYVLVCRKSDGVTGCLMFQHSPRFYWGFEDTP